MAKPGAKGNMIIYVGIKHFFLKNLRVRDAVSLKDFVMDVLDVSQTLKVNNYPLLPANLLKYYSTQ